MNKPLMLVVDDSELQRELIKDYFGAEYTVIEAVDGRDGKKRIEEQGSRLGLIFLDMIMPEEDGLEVLKWLQGTEYSQIPVIALTVDKEYQVEALNEGAWDFITKPAEPDVIRARVKNVLGRAKYLEDKKLLEKALEESRRASVAKNEFLSNMSHDMRTPMNAIIGYTGLGLNKPGDAELLYDYMQKINVAGKYLSGLIDDTLNMSTLENDKLNLNLQEATMQSIFDEVWNTIRPQTEAKSLSLAFNINGYTDTRALRLDKVRVEQILINLLDNAVKYTAEGGRIEFTATTVKAEDDSVTLSIAIGDNGCGISKEFMPKLFKPFEQEDNPVNRAHLGTGLGLAIVKGLADKMGATIDMKSRPGVGSVVKLQATFRVARQAARNEKQRDYSKLAGKRVLLCEDSPFNAEITVEQLKEVQIETDVALNGSSGVQKFDDAPLGYYDAILMDIRMPIMNGVEAAGHIRSLTKAEAKKIPIIALTSNAFEEDMQKEFNAGMDTHVSKPVHAVELYDTLLKYIKS